MGEYGYCCTPSAGYVFVVHFDESPFWSTAAAGAPAQNTACHDPVVAPGRFYNDE